tara:strand:- start:74 stop:1864 length:1791 start_codon:yes stop_codon:yes gene_type:complete
MNEYWSFKKGKANKKKSSNAPTKAQQILADLNKKGYLTYNNTTDEACAKKIYGDKVSTVQEGVENEKIYTARTPGFLYNDTNTTSFVVYLSVGERFLNCVQVFPKSAVFLKEEVQYRSSQVDTSQPEVTLSLFLKEGALSPDVQMTQDECVFARTFVSLSYGKLSSKENTKTTLPTKVELASTTLEYFQGIGKNKESRAMRDMIFLYCEWLQVLYYKDEKQDAGNATGTRIGSFESLSFEDLPKGVTYCNDAYVKISASEISAILDSYIRNLPETDQRFDNREELDAWIVKCLEDADTASNLWIRTFQAFCKELSWNKYFLSPDLKKLVGITGKKKPRENRPQKADAKINLTKASKGLGVAATRKKSAPKKTAPKKKSPKNPPKKTTATTLADLIDDKFGSELEKIPFYGTKWESLGAGRNKSSERQIMLFKDPMKFQDTKDPLGLEEKIVRLLRCDGEKHEYMAELFLKAIPGTSLDQDLHSDLAFKESAREKGLTPSSSKLIDRHYLIWAPLSPKGASLKIKPHNESDACYIFVPKGSFIVFDGSFRHAGVSWANIHDPPQKPSQPPSMNVDFFVAGGTCNAAEDEIGVQEKLT